MITKIEKYISPDYYYICPKCGETFQPFPNPIYLGECESCDWTGDYRNCDSKSAKEIVEGILNKPKEKPPDSLE